MKKGIFFSASLFLAALLPLPALGQSSGTGVAQSGNTVIEHEVQKGDNLHLIAAYYFKDPRQWRQIYDINRQAIRSKNVIIPGKILQIKVDPAKMWHISYAEFTGRVLR